MPDLRQNSGTGLKISQDSVHGDHAKLDTEAPVIEQDKAQEILLENDLPYSIPVPIDQASKLEVEVDHCLQCKKYIQGIYTVDIFVNR